MSIIVDQSAVTSPAASATTTVQQIVNCTSQDIRQLLASSGADANILLDFVNRVSLDMLRASRWTFLLSAVQSFTTTVGEDQYWLGATGGAPAGTTDTALNLTDIRTIKPGSVYDRTNFRVLAKTSERPLGQTFTSNNRPRLWRYDGTEDKILALYPPANGAYTVNFRYYKIHQQLTALNQILQVPNDYKDVVCAGVNELACVYLKRADEAGYWRGIYEEGKREMIRDANLFPRAEEYMRPDGSGLSTVYTPIEVVF